MMSSNLSIDITSLTARTEKLNQILIVLYTLIFIMGLISNLLVIMFVFMNKRHQTITNKFITNLAFADLLVIIVCIPINIGHLYRPFEWVFGWFLCVTPAFFQGISLSVSILTMAAISLDRYYIIYKPFKARVVCTSVKITFTVIAIWLISILIMTPLLFVSKLRRIILSNVKTFDMCVEEDWLRFEFKLAYDTSLFLILFLFPIMFITYTYTKVSKTLWNIEDKLLYERETTTTRTNETNVSASSVVKNKDPTVNNDRSSMDSMNSSEHLSANRRNPCKSFCFKWTKKQSDEPDEAAMQVIFNKKNEKTDCSNTSSVLQWEKNRTSVQFIKTTRKKSNDEAINKMLRSRRRVVKLLVVLVILFVISWLPYHFVNLTISFLHYAHVYQSSKLENSTQVNHTYDESERMTYHNISEFVYQITLCLALANSATNPICYCLLSRGFRSMFKKNISKMKACITDK